MAELFDRDNVLSCEVGWAVKLADRLSECSSFQTLASELTEEGAFGHIYLGPGPLPAFSDEFTEEELANLFLVALIVPQTEEGQRVDESETASADDPDEGSTFVLMIRRYIRPSELQEDQWGDVHNYLWDLSAKLSHELFTQSNAITSSNPNGCPRIRSISRVGMGFNTFGQATTQGGAWLVEYVIQVGDITS